jgi:hypothetical protein
MKNCCIESSALCSVSVASQKMARDSFQKLKHCKQKNNYNKAIASELVQKKEFQRLKQGIIYLKDHAYNT